MQSDGRLAVVAVGWWKKGKQKIMQQENMVENGKKKVTLLFIQLFVTSSKLKF